MTLPQEVEILIVEDNPSDVELTLRTLKRHNLANHIEVMRDGAEALDFLFRTGPYAGTTLSVNPKVILLDLKLPKIDGLEVLRRIRERDELRKIPVVILTSSREDRDLERAYELGANSYVVKPVDFNEFVHSIAQLGLYWLLLNESIRT